MKQFKAILMLLFVTISLCLITACTGGNTPKKDEYTISFVTNGGTSISDVKFAKDEKATKPTDPVLQGATLAAWCTEETLENEFDFDKVPEAKNYTLYAKWNVTITFVTNGGEEIKDYKRDAKEMVILPIAQDLTDRQFLGWYYDEKLENKVESILEVPNQPITLYASWASVEMGTTIYFLEGLVVNEETHYTINKTDDGVTIKPTEDKTAWSYVYSPINLSLEGYSVLHLKFTGTEGSYMTVKLEGGDAKAIEQKFVFTGSEQNEYWVIPNENISKTEGQRILIFVEGDKAGNEFDSEVLIKTLEFCKLKADGEEVDQAIIFNSNGGTLVPTINAPVNTPLTMPEAPTKPGFKFAGWYRDPELTTEFTDTVMPMGPTTLYAKWDDADAHTVTFVTNCDLILDPIEVKEGLVIVPEELEVLGWQFVGWYRNAELTDTNLTMGTEDVTLYAKWKTLKDLSNLEKPYSLMTGWSTTEPNAYTITETNNQISVVATPSKGKWSYISRELAGYDLSYANALHIEFNGKIGQAILIKYNNKVEKKITITKENQEEWIYLTTPVDPSIKLIVFYAPNKTLTENETLTITKFELLDPIEKLDYVDVKKGWVSNDQDQYLITENATNTEITATTAKTTWSFVKVDLSSFEGVDARFVKAINMEFTGPEGHSILIKYNNRKEQKVLLTGEKQAITIEFAEQLDFSIANHFIMFFDGGKTLENDLTITFTKMELVVRHQEQQGEVHYEEQIVDITKGWISADAGVYEIVESEDKTVVTANTTKGTYSVLKFVVNEAHKDAKSIRITLMGPAGKTILVKYNNSKEQKYTLTGEVQTIELEFTIPLDLTKSLYIFFEPGKTITEPMIVEFTKIELVCLVEVAGPAEPTYEEQIMDITKGWTSPDAGAYEIVENDANVVVTATTTKKAYSVLKFVVNEAHKDAKSIRITLMGPAGKTILVKYNNAKEQKYTLTGEVQTIELEFAVPFDITKALYIMIEPGKTLTEPMTIEFTKIELVCLVEVSGGEVVEPTYEEQIMDITKGWTSPDAGAYEIAENDANVVVTATTTKKAYSVLKFVVNEAHQGAKSIKLTVQGPAGKTILVKYNNAKEQKYTLTGEVQTIELEFAVPFDITKALYIMIEPGKTLTEPMTIEFTKIELVCLVEVK